MNEQTARTDAGDRPLSIPEIQERLCISRTFVRALQDSGEIPSSKLGKLRKSSVRDVDACVRSCRVEPGLGLELAEKTG